MKKKGLSFDEKRERMLKIFHERKEVLNLKELEKYAPKSGIVLQTVKDVLDSLLSDDLVEGDKIGAANFYWSLPSKTYQNLTNKIKEYDTNIEKLTESKLSTENDIILARQGREETEERKKKLEQLKKLKQTYDDNLKAIDKYKRNDPERLKILEKETKVLKDKVNQWTDNIYLTKQWISNKFPLTEDEINKSFNIPSDLENIQGQDRYLQ